MKLFPSLHRGLRRAMTAAGLLVLASLVQAASTADDERGLPDSLRRGYVAPIDGPADDHAYARGALGLIRTSFGRASLFVAWRVMHLPPGALTRESHKREGSWLHQGPAPVAQEDEIAAWRKVRDPLQSQAPAVAPDYFRHGKLKVAGFPDFDVVTGHCGADAYAFATRTLRELIADPSLTDAHRRTWIAGQDAVFAHCSRAPGSPSALPLPPLPSAQAPAKLKALQAYQRAAALFYGDDFAAARKAFDAMAAEPGHPMRPWAVLGALRALVRDTVRDPQWKAAVDDAWVRRQLRGAAFSAALAEPIARRNARVGAALREFELRVKDAMADATLAPVHAPIFYTARRAYMQLLPIVPLQQAMTALGRAEYNPYTMGALDLFQALYPQVAADRPEGEVGRTLRQHDWFDFVVTVQACRTPEAASPCEVEHAHALGRWQATQDNAWLLASLMTAWPPSAADLPAAEAARAVPASRPEWASLQFHAARVLRAQGRTAEARAALDALADSTLVHPRDRALLEAERRAL